MARNRRRARINNGGANNVIDLEIIEDITIKDSNPSDTVGFYVGAVQNIVIELDNGTNVTLPDSYNLIVERINTDVLFVVEESEGGWDWNLTINDNTEINVNDLISVFDALAADFAEQVTEETVNDAPTLSQNQGLTIDEGQSQLISNSLLQVTDADNLNSQLTYVLTQEPNNGSLTLDGVEVVVGGSFSQADIDNGLISYSHNDSETTSDSFAFTVSDGDGGTLGETTFNITVNPVNDSPPPQGTANDDAIDGTVGGDVINGLGGNDTINGLTGNDILSGNGGNDSLTGAGGKDVLDGGRGSDGLVGGKGRDTLTGGVGKDNFVFNRPNERTDNITDFKSRDDTILLSGSNFGGGLTKGTLASDNFVLGKTAQDEDDRLIYNPKTGALFFDRDGIGGMAKIKIATLLNQATINASDIVILCCDF
jgi:Ca2+-binding RTX toxin-like protein